MRSQLSPWRLTGYALLQILLLPLTLVFVVLSIVAGALAVITVGIPLLLVTLPVLRWSADLHRRMAAATLGHPVPEDRLPTAGLGAMARIRTWAMDPMTWREVAWALVGVPVGFVLSLLTLVLLVVVVTGALWWYGAPQIMGARAGLDRWFLCKGRTERLEERVEVLTESRAASVDHAAAELRRIERDLHDGAQARLVALGMTLGMAEQSASTDPEATTRLLAEARETTTAALGDIRFVLRGIHPPVLADRGLVGAVQALALDMALPVTVTSELRGRLTEPLESAVYFAVAECLANVGKHAVASEAWIGLDETDDLLRVVVGDDGRGGASAAAGSGLRGVARRLSAFDGTMRVSSPTGGPTLITMEVPCASS
ncbi:sensor histidine kinase [Nocardioides daejeonensis]|uniref:sensor histidine kinase n=1 Tax=Nocardioides daejeonensis TaxID=1046556 RepID=UPI0013A5B507|nr:sensor domain-containing protein [Nocardioides daejeonensis]